MMPWLVLDAIGLFLGALQLAATVFTLNIGGIVGSSIGLVIGAHYFMVVWSYKKEVEAGGRWQVVFVSNCAPSQPSQKLSALPTYTEAVDEKM